MRFELGPYTFYTETDYKISLKKWEDKNNIMKIKIMIDFEKPTTPNPVVIRWTYPCKNIFSHWNAEPGAKRALNPNWLPVKNTSRSAEGTPLQMHLSCDGINEITVSLSDTLTPMELATGVIEETAEISYKLTLFTKLVSPMEKYETVLTIDTRKLPYEEVLSDTSRLWYEETSVPDAAKEPMYSTWYSYHQNLEHDELIKELKSAKRLGMETVIIDDGWQTCDGQRGYAHCGDWKPERLTDMKGFVSDVHELGMKCMLWYSVPFVGKYSKAWERFQGKYLDAYDERHPWCRLDPRYPEVREYLINIYEKAVKEWNLDGLKLDFIDHIQLTEESAAPNDDMDYSSLEDAICALLSEIKERLTALKSDILIEFRQPYTGPVMRRYGNMLRAADCPQDAIKNRAAVVDLRLISGKTAVHSDMLMWNYEDTAESAALQIINVIFSVLQISVIARRLTDKHKKMLEFYLAFWKENKYCLMDGKLSAHNPEIGYSLVSSETNDKIIAASYTKNVMSIKKVYKEIVFINGSWDDELYINNKCGEMKAKYTIYTCTGMITDSKSITLQKGVNAFFVPKSGMVRLNILYDIIENSERNKQMDVINSTSSEWIEKQRQIVSETEFDLIKRSVKVLEDNTTDDTNMPWGPYRGILPGKGTFDGIWNWDSAFHAMAVSRWDIQLAKECILGFVRFQDDNGLFPDVIFSDGRIINDYSKPPVFPWAAEIVYRRSNDVEFLKEVYPRFVKNESFLCENRCYNGLFFYDAQDKDSPEYNTNARYESGLDNSVRWDEPIAQLWAVDLNCYMVMMYRSMKYFAQELYLEADIQKWSERETALTKLIEEKLWDDDNKYYCDANRFTGKHSAVLTPASFMPLFIGTASEERAKYMNGYASDSNKFYSGMPTVTYDNPAYSTDYWRGPTWLNVAYFAAKGLKNYGFETADTIKKTILSWCDSDKRGIFENYNSTTGEGMCCDHFSWSAAFIIEFILNF